MPHSSPIELARVRALDLDRPEVMFTDGVYVYATSGKRLGRGGTGNVWLLTRWQALDPTATPETVVAKTFRDEFLFLLREDGMARRHFEHNQNVLQVIQALNHPFVVPVLLSAPIQDNHLFITPLVGDSLVALLATTIVSPRDRLLLFTDAVRGLAGLHAAGVVHRDFTLHNVLTLGEPVSHNINRHAAVFDFDLSLMPDRLPDESITYDGYYQGRVAGSPEYSVAPELLDEVLIHEPIAPRVDVYAIGTALFALFTNNSIYGETPDLPTLLFRIAEGIVHRGDSRIEYPDEVPPEVRGIIETCVERDPAARYADASAVLIALETATTHLPGAEVRGRYRTTMGYVPPERKLRHEVVFAERDDPTVTLEEVRRVDLSLARQGYIIEKSLGRVKEHLIFLAQPDPDLVAAGRFGEDNYRKIVTALEVSGRSGGQEFVETWLGRIRPIVDRVRQGFLTALKRVVYDKGSGLLLLFSEYVADARFGPDLQRHELTLEEVFGLALIIALPIAQLHDEGLAHNNVQPRSLLLQGRKKVGQVRAMFVGLVEPSFDPAALEEDVRNLSGLIVALIRQARIDALRAEVRPSIAALREDLERLAAGDFRTPTIGVLVDAVAGGLGLIDRNFEVLRVHGGDTYAYVDMLVRHSLYNKLFGPES